MQTICDKCKKPVKKVGRLSKVRWRGLTQKLCKDCRKKFKLSYR